MCQNASELLSLRSRIARCALSASLPFRRALLTSTDFHLFPLQAQKSGGDEILAIRAFAIKSIWLGHLNFPLRDDDGARDDLFCTYAAVAKLRMRLAIKRQ